MRSWKMSKLGCWGAAKAEHANPGTAGDRRPSAGFEIDGVIHRAGPDEQGSVCLKIRESGSLLTILP